MVCQQTGHRWMHYIHRDETSALSSGKTKDVLHCSQYSPDSSITFYVRNYIKQCVKQKSQYEHRFCWYEWWWWTSTIFLEWTNLSLTTLNAFMIHISCGSYLHQCYDTNLEIHFIHSDNKKIYVIFKKCCITCFISTKCHLFHNFIFFWSNNKFLTNHMAKFKYPSWKDKSSS